MTRTFRERFFHRMGTVVRKVHFLIDHRVKNKIVSQQEFPMRKISRK